MIIGNERAIRLLNYSKESPTHILKGPMGVGKATIAKALAKSYLCMEKKKKCACISCRKFKSGNHPDYIYIGLKEKENSIKVEDIMPVIHEIMTKPMESAFKVILIDDADSMTVEAQNKLLKTIEDVPEYIKILLVAHSSLLPTIESRCIVHHFYSLSPDEMSTFADNIGLTGFRKELLLGMANGSPGVLVRLNEGPIIDYFSRTIDMISKKASVSEVLETNGLLKEKDSESIIEVLGRDIVYYVNGLYMLLLDLLNVSLGEHPRMYKSKSEDLKKVKYDKNTVISAMNYLNPIILYTNDPYKEITGERLIKLFDIIFN